MSFQSPLQAAWQPVTDARDGFPASQSSSETAMPAKDAAVTVSHPSLHHNDARHVHDFRSGQHQHQPQPQIPLPAEPSALSSAPFPPLREAASATTNSPSTRQDSAVADAAAAIVKLASRGEPVSLQVPVFQKRQADASDSSSFGDNTPTVAPAAGAASPSDMASGHRSTPRSKRRKADFVNYASILIQRLFGCSSAAPAGFDVPLPAFINTIMSRTRISVSTLVTAFLYLTRLKSMHPKCKGNEGSAHRLTLAAIVIAAKFIYDDTFDNTAWAAVSSGIFRLEEINNMEMEILHFMGYILFVTDDNYQTFYAAVDREIGLIMVASAPDTDMETAMAATRRLREAQKIAFAAASASSGQTVDIGAIEKSCSSRPSPAVGSAGSLSASKTAVSASTASSTSATEAWACANANAVRPATYPPSSNAAAAYQPASRIPVYNPYTAVSAHASTAVASSMTRTISHADGYHPLQQQSLQQQDVLPFAMVPPPLPKAVRHQQDMSIHDQHQHQIRAHSHSMPVAYANHHQQQPQQHIHHQQQMAHAQRLQQPSGNSYAPSPYSIKSPGYETLSHHHHQHQQQPQHQHQHQQHQAMYSLDPFRFDSMQSGLSAFNSQGHQQQQQQHRHQQHGIHSWPSSNAQHAQHAQHAQQHASMPGLRSQHDQHRQAASHANHDLDLQSYISASFPI